MCYIPATRQDSFLTLFTACRRALLFQPRCYTSPDSCHRHCRNAHRHHFRQRHTVVHYTTYCPEGTACSPLTNPTVTNGRCITTNVVSTQCVGQQLAKSNQCAASQFCCFRAPQAVGGAGVIPPRNRLTVEVSLPSDSAASISTNSKGSCRPATNPSANGQCIVADNLASLCKGRQASKSADCAGQEWCCILNQDDSTRLHVSAAGILTN